MARPATPGTRGPRARRRRIHRRRRLVAGAVLAALLATAFAVWASGAPKAASGASPGEEVQVQTDGSLPARDVTLIGASPEEAPGETWGVGEEGEINSSQFEVFRYTAQGGWSVSGTPLDSEGKPLAEFQPVKSDLMGAMTPQGDGELIGTAVAERKKHQVLLLRNPGGVFTEVVLPNTGPGALMHAGENVFEEGRTPLLTPLDEGGQAGVFLIPVSHSGGEEQVLHYDGQHWTAEPIEVPAATAQEGGGFHVLAIAATSPGNAWLLAQLSAQTRNVALFHRSEGRWKELAPGALTDYGSPFAIPGAAGSAPRSSGQILTVTGSGVWVDGERPDLSARMTMFLRPSPAGEEASATEVQRVWCDPGEKFEGCDEELPLPTPIGPSRSFAWSGSGESPYGERVITGFGEGVTLRLEGSSFKRVLALGGSEAPDDVGGEFGAAFSSAREGWLGNDEMPVHLTLNPVADRLQYWPVPFHYALAAVAPQPGAVPGALSSGAVVVGEHGEVARYVPGEGWEPETLFGPGGRHETPSLRAVAWPTPNRVYAVGVLSTTAPATPQMWLWRGETGLWEPDPAVPLNFRGNLLGIAFDPGNPSRAYAVGEQGVLLRYGKTWTQEPESAIPAEAQGASFTSVAFSGSEALVAFRKNHPQAGGEPQHYTGGLLVNEGSGWRVDQEAGAVLQGAIPWTVAGLADGGAAVTGTLGGLPGTATVIERQSGSGPWQATAPYPGQAPGSLALFREAGVLRAVGSGGLPNTARLEEQHSLPPSLPPELVQPYPLSGGYVVRQTPAGWSDEEHARNPVQDPLGEYKLYDQVYQPDPSSAVLISEDGSAGWAIGGVAEGRHPEFDTADVARYPGESGTPPGEQSGPVQPNATEAALNATQATFAVGGGAQCVAACINRARAAIGPDVWLQSALRQAQRTGGLRAFLYTGPRVTSGIGHAFAPVEFPREFGRYAEILGSTGGAPPVFPVASESDRGPGSECEFQEAFGGFQKPLGAGADPAGVVSLPGPRPSASCDTYYAFSSTGPAAGAGRVRVIVIDTTAVGEDWSNERAWLASELAAAETAKEPSLVVGSADLNAEIAAHRIQAEEAAQTIIAGHASAYFYDAPEENVEVPLDGSATTAFGSGTLGYGSAVRARLSDYLGANGFLLVHVNVAARQSNNLAPVSARLIPNVGELALEAEQGTLLRRSQVASFAGLARRPRAGGRSQRGRNVNEASLYIPIPENCVGASCAHRIAPEYTISSSDPEIGKFVTRNTAVSEPNAVLRGGPKDEPLPLGEQNQDLESGLFCAFLPGQTEVTISAGGLSASLTVTVQAGSVRQPCGTVPDHKVKGSTTPVPVPPSQLPNSNPVQVGGGGAPPPVVPVPPLPAVQRAPAAPKPAPFTLQPLAVAPLLPFLPPPIPTPARPSPPSGTSAVTSPVEVAEHEEESEEAPESVSNKAVAYRREEHEPNPAYILGVILLAALAGASARRSRRGPREVRLAEIGRSSRRAGPGRRRRWW